MCLKLKSWQLKGKLPLTSWLPESRSSKAIRILPSRTSLNRSRTVAGGSLWEPQSVKLIHWLQLKNSAAVWSYGLPSAEPDWSTWWRFWPARPPVGLGERTNHSRGPQSLISKAAQHVRRGTDERLPWFSSLQWWFIHAVFSSLMLELGVKWCDCFIGCHHFRNTRETEHIPVMEDRVSLLRWLV